MVRHWFLVPAPGVRIPPPQPKKRARVYSGAVLCFEARGMRSLCREGEARRGESLRPSQRLKKTLRKFSCFQNIGCSRKRFLPSFVFFDGRKPRDLPQKNLLRVVGKFSLTLLIFLFQTNLAQFFLLVFGSRGMRSLCREGEAR